MNSSSASISITFNFSIISFLDFDELFVQKNIRIPIVRSFFITSDTPSIILPSRCTVPSRSRNIAFTIIRFPVFSVFLGMRAIFFSFSITMWPIITIIKMAMIINIMRVACLFSGGKDSCFALFWAISQGFDPFIITVIPEEYSEMFHHPNINATSLQAKAIGIRQVWLDATDKNWHGKLKSILKKEKAEGIVTGAIASEFQRVRID